MVEVDRPNAIVNVIKKAEDEDDDTIVRCYETDGVATATTISLPLWSRVIDTRFDPCEIKTFRIPADATLPVVETDLIEW